MNTSLVVGSECWIDGEAVGSWQIQISQELQTLRSTGPRWDERWSAVDSAGHFHAFSSGDTHFPTLTTKIEEVPCTYYEHDNDCDSANITHYHCAICDEEMTPGLWHGEFTTTLPGVQEWKARISWPATQLNRIGDRVSVRGKLGDREVFGVAILTIPEVSSGDIRRGSVTAALVGIGGLGSR